MLEYISYFWSFKKRLYYYLWTRRQLEEYGIKLGQKECEDRQGRRFTWLGTEDGTYGIFKEIAEKQMGNDRYLQTVVDIKQLELRDDDVMICTFPRAGMHLSLVVRKPVFGVPDQVRHKPGCTATEDG